MSDREAKLSRSTDSADAHARIAELEARLASESAARSKEARARAEAEKKLSAEVIARTEAEKNLAKEKNQRTATDWLTTIVDKAVRFDSIVSAAIPHQTPRHASSSVTSSSTSAATAPAAPPPLSEEEVAEAAIKALVELKTSAVGAFWRSLPGVDQATVDRATDAVCADATLQLAYDAVLAARSMSTSQKADEVALVHPLAHALFDTILASSALLPADVLLYKEKRSATAIDKAQTRHPDLLLFRHAPGAEVLSRFGSCQQRNGLLSIELKSVLDGSHESVAHVELLRDYGHTIGQGGEAEKPQFFGLAGDGVSWIASRWQTVFSSVEKPFRCDKSERFELDLSRRDSVRAFVERVLRLVSGAIVRGLRSKTGWSVDPLDVGGRRFEVVRVLAATKSCVVAECSASGAAGTFALKIARKSDDKHRCAEEARIRAPWLELANPPPFISRCTAVDFYSVAPTLRLETVGTVLERECLCETATRMRVATMVLRDVGAALSWLHSQGLAFVDLHPGNVVLATGSTDGAQHAYLIDLESCSPLGTATQKPIRGSFRTLALDAVPSATTDKLALMLVLAWVLDVAAFRTRVARIEPREAGASDAAALLALFPSLEEFVAANMSE
jgi:hypothetical protein